MQPAAPLPAFAAALAASWVITPANGSCPSAAPVTGNAFAVARLTPKPATLNELARLMPNCFSTERCTSATVTFSITWSSPSMVSRLMIGLGASEVRPLVPVTCVVVTPPVVVDTADQPLVRLRLESANWVVISAARVESSTERTLPCSTTAEPASSVRMFEPGNSRLSSWSSSLRSLPTVTSSVMICWPWLSKKMMLVPPGFLAIRNTRSTDWTTASTLSGSDTSTSRRSIGNWMISDLPMPSPTFLASGKWLFGEMVMMEFWIPSFSGACADTGASRTGRRGRLREPASATSAARRAPDILIRMVADLFELRWTSCTTGFQLTPYARDFTP